jgi:KaiC/GvpD/RAD55 family RecA-like ATPase
MSDRPITKIGVNAEAIPKELQVLPRWVLWKHEKVEERWQKVPYQVSGKRRASSNKAETWGSFDEALSTYLIDDFDGVGFVFNGDGIVGVDLDDAVKDGVIAPHAQEALSDVAGYAELSPSGEGLHIITRAAHASGKKKGIEVYSTGRYFTFTGKQLNGHAALPAERQDISPFMVKHFGAPSLTSEEAGIHKPSLGRTVAQMRAALKYIPPPETEPECTPYIWAARHESDGAEEALELIQGWLCGALHDAPQPKYDEAYVTERWDRANDSKERAKTWRSVEATARENGWPGIQKSLAGNEFVQAAQFAAAQEVEWHIKHVLPKRALTIIYGEPGCGKSFFTLDLVAHIARGVTWRGNRTKRSSIAYIAAEGVAGFGNRLRAYSQGHDVPLETLPLYVRGGMLTLRDQTLAVIEAVSQLPDIGVVVIDTLAAVTPGSNENSSEDMGAAIASIMSMVEILDVSVILVHHTNKQESMRGWSGLLGAADSTIRVFKKEDQRGALIEKMKEGKDSGEFGFILKTVDLGLDADGDLITSCIIEETEEVPARNEEALNKKSKDFNTHPNFAKARMYLQLIQDLIGPGEANVDENEVIQHIQDDSTVNPLGEPDYPRKDSVKRTLLTLGEFGKIRREGRWIRLC